MPSSLEGREGVREGVYSSICGMLRDKVVLNLIQENEDGQVIEYLWRNPFESMTIVHSVSR